ncbi:MAG: hypothetical protein JKX67_11785 [Colwellia sp.]|nr:hypothetical protein [Colwellia sp.]
MNILKYMKGLMALSIVSTSLLATADEFNNDYSVRALYGDPTFDRVVAIDVPEMTFVNSIPTASTPYPVDAAGYLNKAYAITRGVNSIDIIDPDTLSNMGSIALDHKPRSGEAHNGSLNLILIAGADKPMTSIINPETDMVVATAGDNVVTVSNGDYGGGLASGHPFWFSKRKFAVIDRANRKIKLYKLKGNTHHGYRVKFLDEIETPTTVHHFVSRYRKALHGKDKFLYYALAEGSPSNNIAPKLLEIKVRGNKIKLKRSVTLSGFEASSMGSHHADIHPDGKHIYMGSTEGHMFVINRKSMAIVSVIDTGLGSGHTRFIADKNMAVVTNHKDTFVTIIDTQTHTKITDVIVSPPQVNGQILQSHTSFVDPDGNNFYAFASDSGVFYELNLNSLIVTRTVETGGTPRQGVFISSDDD